MKRLFRIIPVFPVLLALLFCLPVASAPAAEIELEIFYLPHRPALAVVAKVEQLAAEFGGVTIRKYSFEDRDTGKLLKQYQLTDHMPVAIIINGRDRFTVAGRSLRLRNFPKGDAFVPMFAGEWDYADLRAILAGLDGGK